MMWCSQEEYLTCGISQAHYTARGFVSRIQWLYRQTISVCLCSQDLGEGLWCVGISCEMDMSCSGQTSTTRVCVLWTTHKSRAWEMDCFIHNLKVIGERFPGTKISKEHKKNTYERKITFNHPLVPKSMKSTQPSPQYSAALPLFP